MLVSMEYELSMVDTTLKVRTSLDIQSQSCRYVVSCRSMSSVVADVRVDYLVAVWAAHRLGAIMS